MSYCYRVILEFEDEPMATTEEIESWIRWGLMDWMVHIPGEKEEIIIKVTEAANARAGKVEDDTEEPS